MRTSLNHQPDAQLIYKLTFFLDFVEHLHILNDDQRLVSEKGATL